TVNPLWLIRRKKRRVGHCAFGSHADLSLQGIDLYTSINLITLKPQSFQHPPRPQEFTVIATDPIPESDRVTRTVFVHLLLWPKVERIGRNPSIVVLLKNFR